MGRGPFPTTAQSQRRAGPHRAPQDTLAAEIAHTRPVLRVLVPDAAMLPTQLLLTLAVLSRPGAP